MKRSSELDFIFDDLFAFIKMLIQNYGEPVRSCEETIEELNSTLTHLLF